ncbi:hypothetical protein SAMN05216327_10349 [Dyadobacter sp. SG02]|nr:hypothetical protein SAMN05216327_10349 [Dyadobacter sp. SG02]
MTHFCFRQQNLKNLRVIRFGKKERCIEKNPCCRSSLFSKFASILVAYQNQLTPCHSPGLKY